MKNNTFDRGLQAAVAAAEAAAFRNAEAFWKLVASGSSDPEADMAARAAEVAARLHAELSDNMNPQRWA